MDKWQDKWAWDREHIKHIRETLEPYDDYEFLMVKEARENPFWLDIWLSHGDIEKRVLPSGLTILTKLGDGKFEQYVLTDNGEVLDFQHEPKNYRIQLSKPIIVTSELILKVEQLIAKLKKRGK